MSLTSCDRQTITLSYGAFVNGNRTTFKLLAPKANAVFVVIFDSPTAQTGTEYSMDGDDAGDWTLTLNHIGYGTLYGYRLEGPSDLIDPNVIIADPYSKAAVTQNTYRHVAKSLILNTDYDWEGDSWVSIKPRDLLIYEIHVRDMTAHPSSGAKRHGTYRSIIDPNQQGGIVHIKDMGYNAVQILPVMDFANVEVPYKERTTPIYNTWNPYARNHWGYMTTFFFAPESYYASDGTNEAQAWNGSSGSAVTEFKDMVKAFHKENITVIMDVVYNHVSNYDYHPFKYIDRSMYFRLDEKGNYIAQSGCGNDCRTEHPAMRQLIVESLKYWMTEYHIDGFRFDLGYLIDPETRNLILAELRKINPNVTILAEPWGGGYDPNEFSKMGWASFNDQIRNGVKGQNPIDGLGFIFGKWQGDNDQDNLQRYAMGSLVRNGGQYISAAHSVNYLESHDDHTFGDFVRIGSGMVSEQEIITDRIRNARVQGKQLALNKLGALFLFTSQGVTFMHQGQEWGRSKVIAPTGVQDTHVGRIDHNSYNKDNETNWLNWEEKTQNKELVDYYKGLIRLRSVHPEFRHSHPDDFYFYDVGSQVAVAYQLSGKFIIVLNGDDKESLSIDLGTDRWKVLVDGKSVNLQGKQITTGKMSVPPSTGLVMEKQSSGE